MLSFCTKQSIRNMCETFGQAVKVHPKGSVIYVTAKPNSKFTGIVAIEQSVYIAVPECARNGKANASLLGLLSKLLKVNQSEITLQKGTKSKNKIFITSLPPEQVLQLLNREKLTNEEK